MERNKIFEMQHNRLYARVWCRTRKTPLVTFKKKRIIVKRSLVDTMRRSDNHWIAQLIFSSYVWRMSNKYFNELA